ncbi:MAG: hypothetical protein KJT03_08505 [Verrucomicrobiae bacterium]|nr:hypothetical protein [Verrucomicrobiae bacterium]
MPENKTTSKLIEIKKYQNRRYYDTTNSQHLSLEKIHRLICEGNDVKVTDAKTGQDITSKILAQILLEYEPMKLDFFSPALLTLVIRLNDKILSDFYESYFNQAVNVFLRSREQFDEIFRRSQSLPFDPSGFSATTRNPFAAWMSMNPFASQESSKKPNQPFGQEMEDLRKQVAELKELLSKQSSEP